MHFERKIFYVTMNLEQILDFCVERECLFNCSIFVCVEDSKIKHLELTQMRNTNCLKENIQESVKNP